MSAEEPALHADQLLRTAGGNFPMQDRARRSGCVRRRPDAGAPRSYEQLRDRAVAVEVFAVRILVAHPEDLIRMKLAAAEFRDRREAKRRQDRDDIAVLDRLPKPDQ